MILRAEIVFVKVIIPFIIGIILAYALSNQLAYNIAPYVLACIFISSITSLFLYKKLKLWQYKKIISIQFILLYFILGFFLCLQNTSFLKANYFAGKNFQQLKVWVNNEPQINKDIMRFEVKVSQGFLDKKTQNTSGKLLIALKIDSLHPPKIDYGSELIIPANYHPVEPPYNPYEFDFKKWLATKNIYQQTFIRQDQLIQTSKNVGNPIIKFALNLRKKQIEIYRQLIKDDEAFAVASTLVLGYRADLSKETLSAYSKTGTIHALSVSGMHVGIIYIMLNWLLLFLDKRKIGKIIKVILIIFLIWAYALLTGFSPSVLRAAIMLSMYVFAKQFKRNSNSYNILAFAAFILLVYNPFFIWDVGFQLSFISVFGLIYFQPKIYAWFNIKNKYIDQLWGFIALSLAAQLATMPLSIYYFHQFPVYFVISNLFILIPVSLMMYLGIAILVLKMYYIAPIFEWIIIFNNKGLKWIASLPYASLSEIWLNVWQLLLLCFLLLFFTIALVYFKKKSLFYGIISLLVFQAILSYQKINLFYQKEILLFSLRKNYAAVFIEGKEAILLTDLAKEDKNYEFFVKPALDRKNIQQIRFINWDEDYHKNNFTKAKHQIYFNKISFLLIDEKFNHKKITNRPTFYAVWKHNNPKYAIDKLKEEVGYNELILDASNKDYYLAKSIHQADSLKIPVTVLKKEKSVTLNLY